MAYGNTRMSPKGKFGEWVAENVFCKGFSYGEIAKICKLRREYLSHVTRHIYKPSFHLIVTLCWAFGMEDDPNDIWKLVEEDWGDS